MSNMKTSLNLIWLILFLIFIFLIWNNTKVEPTPTLIIQKDLIISTEPGVPTTVDAYYDSNGSLHLQYHTVGDVYKYSF